MGRGLANSPSATGQQETLMPGRLATLSPGIALQRRLLRLSHEVRIINPFKSPLQLLLLLMLWLLPCPWLLGPGRARSS